MTFSTSPLLKAVLLVAMLLVCVGVYLSLLPLLGAARHTASSDASGTADTGPKAELATDAADTVILPAEVVEALGLQTVEVRRATRPRRLELAGSLGLDTHRLARVHARFSGEVVEIGTALSQSIDGGSDPKYENRPLGLGDLVAPGQLLAVVWSKDLGEKKSELVDCASKLRLDQETLTRLEELYRKGAVAERSVHEAQRNVETDLIALERARRTLRSWQLPSEEIRAIESEADPQRLRQPGTTEKQVRDWARVEVRAPFAGTILERNVSLGDVIDTSTDLFKIADLRHLRVLANAPEEDLPLLQALPRPIAWAVRIKADRRSTPLPGQVEQIGHIVDPNDHTARVMGMVDNRDGRLKSGQYVVVTIEIPPAAHGVEVPTSALAENGRDSIVFVQSGAEPRRFQARRVSLLRREHDIACIDGAAGPQPLRPGERVVTAGAIELRAALEDLKGR